MNQWNKNLPYIRHNPYSPAPGVHSLYGYAPIATVHMKDFLQTGSKQQCEENMFAKPPANIPSLFTSRVKMEQRYQERLDATEWHGTSILIQAKWKPKRVSLSTWIGNITIITSAQSKNQRRWSNSAGRWKEAVGLLVLVSPKTNGSVEHRTDHCISHQSIPIFARYNAHHHYQGTASCFKISMPKTRTQNENPIIGDLLLVKWKPENMSASASEQQDRPNRSKHSHSWQTKNPMKTRSHWWVRGLSHTSGPLRTGKVLGHFCNPANEQCRKKNTNQVLTRIAADHKTRKKSRILHKLRNANFPPSPSPSQRFSILHITEKDIPNQCISEDKYDQAENNVGRLEDSLDNCQHQHLHDFLWWAATKQAR